LRVYGEMTRGLTQAAKQAFVCLAAKAGGAYESQGLAPPVGQQAELQPDRKRARHRLRGEVQQGDESSVTGQDVQGPHLEIFKSQVLGLLFGQDGLLSARVFAILALCFPQT